MKTKFTRIIPVLVGLFLLITASARAQNHPGNQRDPLPDFRNSKGMGLSPYSGMAGMKPNTKQAIFKNASITNNTNTNVKLIGRWGNGPCFGVATDSNYVYFGNGAYFQIAALHDTTGTVLGKILLPSFVNVGIKIRGQYAYVTDSKAGLYIINISDPYHPAIISSIKSGWAMGLDISGNLAYVAGGDGLHIMNISDPAHPVETGFFDTGGEAIGVSVSGNYAYVADGGDGLRIINISDPAHPVETGFFDTDKYAEDVTVNGNYAYVADDDDGLRIINISDPAHPVETGFFDTDGYAEGVIVRGQYAYLTDYSDGLRIIDISNPASPVVKSFFDTEGNAFGLDVSGNSVYVADMSDMVAINIKDIANPAKTETFKTGGAVYSLAVAGQFAYLADKWNNQLHIIDIKNPAHPVETGFFDLNGRAYGVAVNGDYAYVADYSDGLRIINISDPAHPVETGFFDTDGRACDVAVNGSYAYVADGSDGLRIINISDPAHPRETGFYITNDYAYGVTVNGDYAYVGDNNDGLRIINISDPAHPVETGFFDTGSLASGVAINGDYAYVADFRDGLRIINISDPAHPVETGFYDTDGQAYDVAVEGDYAYVADEYDGLRIININDPANPVETDAYVTGDWNQGIIIANGLIYLADGRDGMYILGSSTLPRSHFKPVWSGNPYQPMAILVKDATLFGDSLQPDDEIGVFTKDSLGNEICVGDARVDTTLPHRSPLNITVSADDPTTAALDGFRNGDTIYYKIWSEKKQKVFSNIVPVYNKIYDTTFNALGTAVVSLYGFGHYKTVWEGNPYQPMNILIDTIVVPDSGLHPNDEIGLFNTDKAGNEICVGTGIVSGTVSSKHPLTVVASADDPATPKTDGFTSHHTIIYKLWSSVSQKEYTRYVARYNPAFDSLYSPLGTSLVGISFIKMVSQKIPLITGWNIMSFNTVPDTLNMLSLVNPLVSSGSLVKVIDEKGGFVQNIPGNGWMNTIGDMANTEGYYINVSHDDTLQTTGKQVILPFTIPLQTGWNLMGYPLRQRQDAITALNKLIDSSRLVKVVDEKGGFIQNIPGVGWMNTLGNFEPDKGYYIKVTKNTRLTLNKPTKAAPVSGIPFTGHPVLASQYFNKAFKANPYFPMDIVVTHIRFNGYNVQPGDEIAVFDQGVCVGTGVVPEDTSRPIIIVASQDDPTTPEMDGYRVGDPITFRYMSAGLADAVKADPKVISGKLTFSPLATTVCGITASPEAVKEHLNLDDFTLRIYPNPAKAYATISIHNPYITKIHMEILDLTGKVVKVLFDKPLQKGNLYFRGSLAGLTPGVYDVRVFRHTNNQTVVNNYKIAIIR